MTIIEAAHISKSFPIESGVFKQTTGIVKALDTISFSLVEGQVLGIVGESGSGKSTLGRILCRLIKPDNGTVFIEGKPIDSYSRNVLAGKLQMIFQNPFASLNPKLSIATMLHESLAVTDRKKASITIEETLHTVGLEGDILPRYPHQFSGGQRQRIALARALLKNPKILIADEPLSSLDLSIQNQLLNLFIQLKEKNKLTILFISHDLVVTSNLADYLIVLKNGVIAEEGKTRAVLSSPQNPYTQNLLSAIPKI